MSQQDKAQHTPGPWAVVNEHPDQALLKVKSKKGEVASIYNAPDDKVKQDAITGVWPIAPIQRANAALIASAPDLVDALTALIEFARHGKPIHTNPGLLRNACAALKKAGIETTEPVSPAGEAHPLAGLCVLPPFTITSEETELVQASQAIDWRLIHEISTGSYTVVTETQEIATKAINAYLNQALKSVNPENQKATAKWLGSKWPTGLPVPD